MTMGSGKSWITRKNIDFYRENGFVRVDGVLVEEELEELRAYIGEAMEAKQELAVNTDREGGAYYKVLNQKVNTWRDHGGMAKYSLHPRFAGMAQALTGVSGIRLFHDHALWKMPGDSKPTPWHQDTPKWPMRESGALSIWIALDDVDERNGCMMFVPKSRNAGKLKNMLLTEESTELLDSLKGTELESEKPVKVPLKAGSCTFHDGLTFHYAFANRTDKPRRALAIIYMADGTSFDGKGHIVTNGQELAEGDRIRGPLFPLLAKA